MSSAVRARRRRQGGSTCRSPQGTAAVARPASGPAGRRAPGRRRGRRRRRAPDDRAAAAAGRRGTAGVLGLEDQLRRLGTSPASWPMWQPDLGEEAEVDGPAPSGSSRPAKRSRAGSPDVDGLGEAARWPGRAPPRTRARCQLRRSGRPTRPPTRRRSVGQLGHAPPAPGPARARASMRQIGSHRRELGRPSSRPGLADAGGQVRRSSACRGSLRRHLPGPEGGHHRPAGRRPVRPRPAPRRLSALDRAGSR